MFNKLGAWLGKLYYNHLIAKWSDLQKELIRVDSELMNLRESLQDVWSKH